MAMIMSVCGPGDKIIIPRNVHKSVLSAIIFAGGHSRLYSSCHGQAAGDLPWHYAIQRGVSLQQHPDAKAVLVINPTYYGVACNLKAS